jgi:hypothetical protein
VITKAWPSTNIGAASVSVDDCRLMHSSTAVYAFESQQVAIGAPVSTGPPGPS